MVRSAVRWRVAVVAGVWLGVWGCQTPPEVVAPIKPIVEVPRVQEHPLDPALGPRVSAGPARVQVPAGWVAVPGAQHTWQSGGYGGEGPRAAMTLILGDPAPPAAPPAEIWSLHSAAYKAETAGVHAFVEEGELGGGALPSYLIVSDRTEGGRGYRLFQVLLLGTRHTYYLTYSAPQEGFEALRAGFEGSARTLYEEVPAAP